MTRSSPDTIRPSDPLVILAGIRRFGLAPDGADLRDLEAALRASQPATPRKWDEGEHEGCGIDSQRAYERQTAAPATPTGGEVRHMYDSQNGDHYVVDAAGNAYEPARSSAGTAIDALDGLLAWTGATRLGITDAAERMAFEDDLKIAQNYRASLTLDDAQPSAGIATALREKIAMVMLARQGFGFYSDPMEGGQDAYDITQDALADADAIIAVLPDPAQPSTEPALNEAVVALLEQYDFGAGSCLGIMGDGNPCFKGSFLAKLEAVRKALPLTSTEGK